MSTVRAPQGEQGTQQLTRSWASPRLCHTGGCPAVDTAAGNNSTPVSTELYVAELFVPMQTKVRGIAPFNGSDTTDNIKAALYSATGVMLAATASIAGGTADTYQLLPFTLAGDGVTVFDQLILQPGTYYIGTCYAGTTSRFNTHAVGSFGAGKITGLVFATNFVSTALTITTPKTFTTLLGPLASIY